MPVTDGKYGYVLEFREDGETAWYAVEMVFAWDTNLYSGKCERAKEEFLDEEYIGMFADWEDVAAADGSRWGKRWGVSFNPTKPAEAFGYSYEEHAAYQVRRVPLGPMSEEFVGWLERHRNVRVEFMSL